MRNAVLIVALLAVAACGGQTASTAEAPTPAPSATPDTSISAAAGAVTDDVWLEQPFGPNGRLAVLFYEQGAQSCVRFLVDVPGATPQSTCGDAARDALTAVQAQQGDSAGALYTIVVGRVFRPATRVVAIEMDGGESLSVKVDDGGIILILEGQRHAVRAVPIDEFGNLTGDIFRF